MRYNVKFLLMSSSISNYMEFRTIVEILFVKALILFFYAFQDVPIRLILTSMDQLELYELGSVRSIFRSRDAKLKVEKAKLKFDLQDNQILPVANYVYGTSQDVDRDVLVLQAVKNILQEVLSFIADKI